MSDTATDGAIRLRERWTDKERLDEAERRRFSISYSVLNEGTPAVEQWCITDDYFGGPWTGPTLRDALDAALEDRHV